MKIILQNILGRYLPVLVALLLLGACDKNDAPTPPETNRPARRAILVYAAARNTLSNNLTEDMAEMDEGYVKAGSDADSCRVFLFRVSRQAAEPTLFELVREKGNPTWKKIRTYDNDKLSTDPDRMSEVLADFYREAPGMREYGLVLWSHAAGWNVSPNVAPKSTNKYWFGDDSGQGNDNPRRFMELTELKEVLQPYHFDFIWADCCHMAGVEVLYQLAGSCDWFIAYPTEVIAYGMPYNLVMPHLLAPVVDYNKAAQAFFEYYDRMSGQYRSATVSVSRTAQVETLATACRALINGKQTPDAKGIQYYHRPSTGLGPYYDLLDMCLAYADYDAANADFVKVKQALDEVVTYAATTDRFVNIWIDKDQYCGLSSNLWTDDGSANNDFYKSLDWYHAVYK